MPSALAQVRLGHELDVDQVEQRLRAVLVDHAVRTSALSRPSTRRDHAVSKREREGERPACSCHSGVQPSSQAAGRNVPALASERLRGLEQWPRAVQGEPVVG